MSAQTLWITGATGTLGRALSRACDVRGIEHVLTSRRDVDIADARSVAQFMSRVRPWGVVNAAGYVRVADAEGDAERCHRENAVGPECLAAACAAAAIPFVTYSSDLVFDGDSDRPYVESDTVNPLNVYGRTKAEAERRVTAAYPGALIVRTSAFFGPADPHNFVTSALHRLAGGETVEAPDDEIVSPTYVPDLVSESLDLLIDGESGIWHLANQGATSWYELAMSAASLAGVPVQRLRSISGSSWMPGVPRPVYSALGSERGLLLPKLDDALERYVREVAPITA